MTGLMIRLRKLAYAGIFLSLVSLANPALPRAEADTITEWNNILLDSIRLKKTSPPDASRLMAMMHIAMYDAVNAVGRPYQPYAYQGSAPANTSQETAAAKAAYNVLVNSYGSSSRFDAALTASLAGVPEGAGKTAGIAVGDAAARAILNARTNDGSVNTQPPYFGNTGIGQWRPAPGVNLPGMLPNWGGVTSFSGFDIMGNRPEAPPTLTSAEYTEAYNEVKSLGVKNSSTRTADQTAIASFWSDGAGTETPPGHWNIIAQTVAAQTGNSLLQNARLFALLNISMADAGICCWDMKYQYNFWRPITAIRNGDLDGNSDTTGDTTWTPLLTTPNFPGYASGHSTFSGAASSVLSDFYGTDAIAFTIGTDASGIADRSFSSFSSAANEAAMSRIYGGIHFNFDSSVGLSAGRSIGMFTMKNALQASAPEPAALALFLSGIFGMAIRRCKNKSRD